MRQEKSKPEIAPSHQPEIKPMPPQPVQPGPPKPEISPTKIDPQPSKAPPEVPTKLQ